MVSKRARATNTLGTRLNALQEAVSDVQGRTRTAADDGSGDRLVTAERKLELLNSAHYRYEDDVLVRGSDYVQAVLDPTYIGPGPARVSFLPAGALSTEKYEWRGDYYPWGNRVVNMIRVENRWYIDTHSNQGLSLTDSSGLGGVVEIPLQNQWTNYGTYSGSYQYAEAQAQRLPSGIVVLSGLVGMGTFASGTVVGVLPVGYRPDVDMIFPTLNGNAWRALTVYANGNITVRSGHSQSFVNFDGIAFPAAGVATWTDVGAAGSGSSFGAGTVPNGASQFGNPAYWKDPYGLVWFKGLITSGNTTTDNYTMVNLPATHRANLQQHHAAVSVDGFGLVGAASTNGLNWKNGTAGTAWISLAGITVVTDEAIATGYWMAPLLQSSWVNYDPATFPAFGVTRRPDGLGLSKGLVRTGTVGSAAKVVTNPRHLLPAMSSLAPRPAGGAAGRVDLYGHRNGGSGGSVGTVSVNFGSNSWASFDGMKWMVGEL